MGRDTRRRRGWFPAGPSATVSAVTLRRGIAFGLLAAAVWVLFRPRSVVCPQCRGKGAPPLLVGGELRARICATCGASSTPDLPLVGEADPVPAD